jgi:hypothetical protein
MAEALRLDESTLLARGGKRYVFRHPDNPRLIIKVLQASYLKRIMPDPDNWRRKRKRYKQYITYLQEAREHLAACAFYGEPPRHMQKLVGFVQTDYGPGLIYEAVFGPDGKFAPTLQDLIDRGEATAEIKQAYEEFRAWLIDSPIAITPLHSDNMVCIRDGAGKPYFVLIDGIGERGTVPIKGVIPWLNRRSKRKNFAFFERQELPPGFRAA